jgi:aryl-alcohol dehydrogenase-like predicted oxidoreductase
MRLEISRRALLTAGGAALAIGCGRGAPGGRREAAPAEPPGEDTSDEAAPRAGDDATTGDPTAAGDPAPAAADHDVLSRRIPSSGEAIPAIGLGSWQTFDVGDRDLATVQPVVERFLALGGRVIDSSPMYGRAEAAIGTMLARLRAADPATPAPFLATKVWTSGARAGEQQMRRSMERLGTRRLDLMQIHNLLDWKVHLPTLRAWKEAGTFRYIGITHYQRGAFADLEAIVRREPIDFVQLPYSVVDRTAERRLLPAARDAGVAVLVMTPFESGALFGRVRGKPVPAWAAELDCTSWAQLFLKFLLGHPAVTCPLPATSKVAHVEDNLGALRGRLPDDDARERIARALA